MSDYSLTIPSLTQLAAIFPELVLAIGMCIALLLPLFARDLVKRSNIVMTWIGIITCAVALVGTLIDLASPSLAEAGHFFFYHTLTVDRFSQSVKVLLLFFTICIFLQYIVIGSRKQIRPTDAPDYVSLILGATMGMCLMASASNFLMMFIAIEAASFPSYALAGFRKNSKLGPEASLKYVIFGAAATAIMLYCLSMLYGQYGTLDMHAVAAAVAEQGASLGLAVGMFGLMIGIGFKLSAFPVHFWCPDVFEGAAMEITTFLSFASKGAAVALLLRLMMTFGAAEGLDPRVATGLTVFVGLTGGVTATWGNLVALRQDNIKRMLAYSSIGHAGYMIMACALVGRATAYVDNGTAGVLSSALLFYLIIYLFMNLGAFTIAGLIEQQTGSLRISEWSGFWRRNALLGIMLLICLGSLFGFPPLGGFWGKVLIGLEMWRDDMWWLVAILLINTVISAYYYLLRPAYYMFMVKDEGRPTIAVRAPGLILAGVCAAVLVLTAAPQKVMNWTNNHAVMLLTDDGTTSPMAQAGSGIELAERSPSLLESDTP